jgi:hypothetical protein
MTKSDYGEAMTQAKEHAGAIMLEKAQMDALLEVNSKLLKRLAEIGTAWTTLASETMNSGSNLTQELVRCRDPNEAIRLCNEWLGQRAIGFMTESQRVTGLWLDLYEHTVAPAATALPPSGPRNGPARPTSKP